jgi:hypothetical protein
MLAAEGAVASLSAAGDLPQGLLPVAAGDRGMTAPAGRTPASEATGWGGEVVQGLDHLAGRAAPVGWLERRT